MNPLSRQNRHTSLLAATNILLAAFAFHLSSLELSPASPDIATPPAAQRTQPLEPAAIGVELGSVERYMAIVDRPLFSASRRPPPPDPDTTRTEPTPVPTQFTLEGIVLAPERRSAIFRNITTLKATRVSEGMQLGDWTVETLGPDSVVLKHRDSAHEITLRHFDATPPAGRIGNAPTQRQRHPAH